MQLIHQKCTSLIQEPEITGIYKQIELAGRTCYKSTDKITSESARPFVQRLVDSKHYAMLEHGTVYLYREKSSREDNKGFNSFEYMYDKYIQNPYSKVILVFDNSTTSMCITTNLRVIVENGWDSDLRYWHEPTPYHAKRYTILCTTALHCYKDLTRHRVFSFAIESTRYCNYSNTDKFGEMTFIIPSWLALTPGKYVKDSDTILIAGKAVDMWGIRDNYDYIPSEPISDLFLNNLIQCESTYNKLIALGWKAQQAAEVLPQCIKGDMVITGFEEDWKHLLDLRYYGTTGAPHPMVKELASLIKVELEKQGFTYNKPFLAC